MRWIKIADANRRSPATASLLLLVRLWEITKGCTLDLQPKAASPCQWDPKAWSIEAGWSLRKHSQSQWELPESNGIIRMKEKDWSINGEGLLTGNRHHQRSERLHGLRRRRRELSPEMWGKKCSFEMPTLKSGKATLAISLFWLNFRAWSSESSLWGTWISRHDSPKNEQQRSLFQDSWGRRQAQPVSFTQNERRERRKSTTNLSKSFHPKYGYKWCRLIEDFMPFWRSDRGLDRIRLVV